VGRAGAATQRNLGDSKGQQGITNLEVSSRFAVMHLGCEIAGVSFHTAEVVGSNPTTPTPSRGFRCRRSSRMLKWLTDGRNVLHLQDPPP
jgi:hypothetical protein